MERVQQVGGSAEWSSRFTGLPRQITVDESNHNAQVHDGVTPGGHTLLNQDNADQRYQQRNAEFDAFAGFDPRQRGFLARLGAASYRFCKFTVNGDNLTIVNADGFNGDPLISLAPTIASEHTWSGQQVFQAVVEFEAGINASVSGDTTGTHHGNVEGNLTGDVTGNLTGAHVGDGDFRSHTVHFDDGQIPYGALSDAPTIPGLPFGMIVMWAGDSTDVPAGWLLCDGTEGTPDLRDRFIIGASTAHVAHATGGSSAYTPGGTVDAAGTHSHTITVADHTLIVSEIPSHTHSTACGLSEGDNTANFTNGNNSAGPAIATTSAGGGQPHSHGGSSDDAGNHTHAFSGTLATILPPFYALCFIMKG